MIRSVVASILMWMLLIGSANAEPELLKKEEADVFVLYATLCVGGQYHTSTLKFEADSFDNFVKFVQTPKAMEFCGKIVQITTVAEMTKFQISPEFPHFANLGRPMGDSWESMEECAEAADRADEWVQKEIREKIDVAKQTTVFIACIPERRNVLNEKTRDMLIERYMKGIGISDV